MSLTQKQNIKDIEIQELTSPILDQTTVFICNNLLPLQSSSNENQKNKLHLTVRFLLILAVKANSSYVIKTDKEMIGAYINIDVIDYMNILEKLSSQILMKNIIHISGFEKSICSISTQRGKHLLCLLSVSKIDQENNLMRKELGFMVQGMIICKLIGWDQIIFATNNPVPFLKTNADILEDKFEGINKKYLMILKLSKLTLQKNPFNKNIIPKL